jgi:copper chaperone
MNSRTEEFKIEGMSCGHCVEAVKRAITGVEGVEHHEVTIGSAKVEFDADKVTRQNIEEAIEESGYHVVAAK